MFEGTLIAESLRVGTTLDQLRLMVRKVTRHAPAGTTADQPATWTNIDFEVDDADVEALSAALAQSLDQPGWYADLRSTAETWVVFHGKVFRYQRGDPEGRAQAQEHGRRLGVPEDQLDWPV